MTSIPDLTPLTLEDGAMTSGEDVTCEIREGEVVLLDVWATWCGPCQGPMKHNVEILKKQKETWKDKVRIVALSLDDNLESLKTKIISSDF